MSSISRTHKRVIRLGAAAPTPTPQTPAGVFTTRKYGDPEMVRLMGLDTEAMGTSNFQNIALFTTVAGFGAVSQFQRLDKAALEYLISIQPVDQATLNQKMEFLCGERIGPPKRPYWTRNGEWKALRAGDTSILFEFGTIVFGGQKVKVEIFNDAPVEYKFLAKYQATSTMELITFYKLEGLRRADWGKVSYATHPWFIQTATWAGYPDNSYHTTWHEGTIFHPVWSPLDYPSNYGALYIAKAFLV